MKIKHNIFAVFLLLSALTFTSACASTEETNQVPGTRLFKEAKKEDRLIYTDFPKDWDRYNMTDYVYKLPKMEREHFEKIFMQCIKKIYSKSVLSLKALKTIWYTRSLLNGVISYSANITVRRLVSHYYLFFSREKN
jgi:hypothetical protein